MLAALPYCNFKSYCANTKLNLILIYRLDDCLKHIYLKATNNQYALKRYTPLLLQLYVLLTSNVLLLNAVLSLNNGLSKDLQVGFKWQKLASLAQGICTLWFQFFGAVFASKGYPFKNIFTL